MKTNIIILAGIVMLSFLTSCEKNRNCITGSGGYVTQEFSVINFNIIEVSGLADVYLSNDAEPSLTIEGQANVLSALNIDQRNNQLIIGDDNCFKQIKKLKIYASTPTLTGVYTNGSCNVVINDTFTATSFHARLSGTGSMDLLINADEFYTSIDGDGEIKASGTASFQKYNISGIGKYRCFELIGDDAEIDISGIGDLEINTSSSLDVDISGSGNVLYKGDPSIRQEISGSGSISKSY